jgi:hypothetical protein
MMYGKVFQDNGRMKGEEKRRERGDREIDTHTHTYRERERERILDHTLQNVTKGSKI